MTRRPSSHTGEQCDDTTRARGAEEGRGVSGLLMMTFFSSPAKIRREV